MGQAVGKEHVPRYRLDVKFRWRSRVRTGRPHRLIFVHVPKTGGTTVREILASNYSSEERWPLDNEDRLLAMGTPESDQTPLIRSIKGELPPLPAKPPVRNLELAKAAFEALPEAQRARLRYLYGHTVFGAHIFAGADWLHFAMLRDPIERVLSLYQARCDRRGVELDLETYLAQGRDHQLFNNQTLFLSGAPFEEPFPPRGSRTMLARAKTNLRTHFIVGTTERFDESMGLLQHRAGLRTVRYEKRNVARARPRREDLPQRIIEHIMEFNELDIELHRAAGELLDEQLIANGIKKPSRRH
jgi:hypothetical protein